VFEVAAARASSPSGVPLSSRSKSTAIVSGRALSIRLTSFASFSRDHGHWPGGAGCRRRLRRSPLDLLWEPALRAESEIVGGGIQFRKVWVQDNNRIATATKKPAAPAPKRAFMAGQLYTRPAMRLAKIPPLSLAGEGAAKRRVRSARRNVLKPATIYRQCHY
jgi:hypothetical protein